MRAGCGVGYSLLCFSLEGPGARNNMAPSEPIHVCLVRLPAMLLWANCGERCGYQCCWQIQSHVLPVGVLLHRQSSFAGHAQSLPPPPPIAERGKAARVANVH